MSNPAFAIPGFMTPESPKEAERIFASPLGHIETTLIERQPANQPTPPLTILIGREFGDRVESLWASSTNAYVYTVDRKDGNGCDVLLKIHPSEVTLIPGTYTLLAYRDQDEIFKRFLTLRANPIQHLG